MSSYSQSDIYHSIFSDIYTVFCGMQDCPPSYSFGPAVRDCFRVNVCDILSCFDISDNLYTHLNHEKARIIIEMKAKEQRFFIAQFLRGV